MTKSNSFMEPGVNHGECFIFVLTLNAVPNLQGSLAVTCYITQVERIKIIVKQFINTNSHFQVLLPLPLWFLRSQYKPRKTVGKSQTRAE